jgi:hypothetical protein
MHYNGFYNFTIFFFFWYYFIFIILYQITHGDLNCSKQLVHSKSIGYLRHAFTYQLLSIHLIYYRNISGNDKLCTGGA